MKTANKRPVWLPVSYWPFSTHISLVLVNCINAFIHQSRTSSHNALRLHTRFFLASIIMRLYIKAALPRTVYCHRRTTWVPTPPPKSSVSVASQGPNHGLGAHRTCLVRRYKPNQHPWPNCLHQAAVLSGRYTVRCNRADISSIGGV